MISAIGISTVDHLMVVKRFSKDEGSFYAKSYLVDGGGMAATAMCAAAKLGSNVRLFSCVGNDLNGQFILEGLQSFGIDTSFIQIAGNASSVASFVLIEESHGDKQFWSEKEFALFNNPGKINREALRGSKVLLIDGHWEEAALEAAIWASENNVPVVADFKKDFERLSKLLPLVNYLIIPEFFAITLTGSRDKTVILHTLKKMINGIPVITEGNKGGTYLLNDQLRNYKVYNVDCIDTTGAGDAFHGAFCHFLIRGHPVEDCLDLASAAGALNCRAIGGRRALPDMETLTDFINS